MQTALVFSLEVNQGFQEIARWAHLSAERITQPEGSDDSLLFLVLHDNS